MLSKNCFFSNLNNNLNKTKKIYKSLVYDLENFEIPMMQSYEKKYEYDFSDSLIKKFSKYKNIIVIGMGGSILGTKCIYSFFKKKIKKKLFFFDTLDENLYLNLSSNKVYNNSCFIVVSKSGNTLETITNLNIIFSKHSLRNKLVIITEFKDNNLISIANKFGAIIIEHRDFIGGRYSVLSEAGMFPASLMGLNIGKFKNLRKLIYDRNFTSSLIQNVSSIYTLNRKGVKNSILLNYDPRLEDLCNWYFQLVSESLGKKGKGISPVVSNCPKDHHSAMQLYLDGPKDKFFTFFNSSIKNKKYKISNKIIPGNMNFLKNKNLKSIIDAQYNATMNTFKKKNIPYRYFNFKKNDEQELGTIFLFLVLETILLAKLMEVNPFDQPAVEDIKIETKKILSA